MAGTKGRPTRYTAATAGEICHRIGDGESLRRICRDAHMPPMQTVIQWAIDDRDGFSGQYARARDIANDIMAADIIEFVDDEYGDVARDRLKFDARRWYLSKLAPKRYGDKIEVEHGVNESLADRITSTRERASCREANDDGVV